MRLLRLGCAALALMATPACFQAEVSKAEHAATQSVCHQVPTDGMPKLAGRVTDAANVLSAEDYKILSDLSAKVEGETKVQLAFVTVSSIGVADVADYTCTLGGLWGIGDKERNDGVVILAAMEERKMRISVGTGIETRLPNAKVQAVIDDMRPHFQSSNYGKGLETGGQGVLTILRSQ